MVKQVLDEREFELINILGTELGANQRDLSRLMNLSLGMVNMLIRRLIAKGHIRIQQLNKRKVEYILTPQGFVEKMRKSVKYTLKTINSIGLIRNRLKEIIHKLYEEGERDFFILGESDLVLLVEMTFQEMFWSDCRINRIKELPENKLKGTLLICKEGFEDGKYKFDNCVDLLEEISKDIVAFNQELAGQMAQSKDYNYEKN